MSSSVYASACDAKVEPPAARYARLPDGMPLVILLGLQGRMSKVDSSKSCLLIKGFSDGSRSLVVASAESIRKNKSHLERGAGSLFLDGSFLMQGGEHLSHRVERSVNTTSF